MTWFEDPVALATGLPVWALPALIFLSALMEYVVPPYWGDTIVLVGFFLAGQGLTPPALVFVAAVLGSLCGSMIAYGLGYRYGIRAVRWFFGRRRFRRIEDRLESFSKGFNERVLIVNRFIPVVRGFLLYLAGSLKLRFATSIFYSTLSNIAFVGLLMALGLLTAESWEQVVANSQHYRQLAAIFVVIGLALWLGIRFYRSRSQSSD